MAKWNEHDVGIREALHRDVLATAHAGGCLIVDEFAIGRGACFADVAVLDGLFHGYEIKAACDTLGRLAGQVQHYGRVFDYATVVVAANYEAAARRLIPSWWGVIVADETGLERRQVGERNSSPSGIAGAGLLWNHEIEAALLEVGALRGFRGASRRELTRRLVEVLGESVGEVVQNRLRARGDWKRKSA
jgi:AraC-like DNA-binding protein